MLYLENDVFRYFMSKFRYEVCEAETDFENYSNYNLELRKQCYELDNEIKKNIFSLDLKGQVDYLDAIIKELDTIKYTDSYYDIEYIESKLKYLVQEPEIKQSILFEETNAEKIKRFNDIISYKRKCQKLEEYMPMNDEVALTFNETDWLYYCKENTLGTVYSMVVTVNEYYHSRVKDLDKIIKGIEFQSKPIQHAVLLPSLAKADSDLKLLPISKLAWNGSVADLAELFYRLSRAGLIDLTNYRGMNGNMLGMCRHICQLFQVPPKIQAGAVKNLNAYLTKFTAGQLAPGPIDEAVLSNAIGRKPNSRGTQHLKTMLGDISPADEAAPDLG